MKGNSLTYDELFERWGEASARCEQLEVWQATARDTLREIQRGCNPAHAATMDDIRASEVPLEETLRYMLDYVSRLFKDVSAILALLEPPVDNANRFAEEEA